MAGVKGKSGGRRPGAGRPCKSGCVTTVMRVPSYMKNQIETFIRLKSEWLFNNEENRPIGYLNEEEEMKRRLLIQDMECIIHYEKDRLAKVNQSKKAKEEGKR